MLLSVSPHLLSSLSFSLSHVFPFVWCRLCLYNATLVLLWSTDSYASLLRRRLTKIPWYSLSIRTQSTFSILVAILVFIICSLVISFQRQHLPAGSPQLGYVLLLPVSPSRNIHHPSDPRHRIHVRAVVGHRASSLRLASLPEGLILCRFSLRRQPPLVRFSSSPASYGKIYYQELPGPHAALTTS